MDESIPTAQRRVILRRGRMGGGFSSGLSTSSESLREPAPPEVDDVDDAIDPDSYPDNLPAPVEINRRIRAGEFHASPNIPEPESPRMRMNQVAMAGSQSYAKEYRLQLLNRLLMRNIPLDQIAQQLQVSISTVEKDRVELKKRLREAATQMNIDEMIGGQNAVYDEIAGMALRIASGGAQKDDQGRPIAAVPTAMKLAAMRTALAANADRTRMLNSAGVFDVLRFRRAEDGSGVSDIQQLMMKTLELMESMNEPDVPKAPKAGGFKPMTFDDIDASSSANEIQEL